MKQRSFLSRLIPLLLTLFLSGVISFPSLADPVPVIAPAESTPTPDAAIFVSRQAPVVASLLVHPDRLEALPQAILPDETPAPIRTILQTFKQGLLAGTGLTYERDLRPWIGDEITLAITSVDLDRDLKNGSQPGYLTVATVRSPQLAREALTRLWHQHGAAGFSPVSESYQGTTLTYGKSRSASPSVFAPATAMVGNQFVLFANSPLVLKQAINNVQVPEMALAEDHFYDRALQSLSNQRVGFVYINLPRLSRWLGRPLEPPLELTDTGLAIGIDLRPQGLQLETALLTVSQSSVSTQRGESMQPVQALQYIPANSLLTLSGKDFAHFVSGLLDLVPDRGLFADLDRKLIGNLQHQWGTELPWELMDPLHEDYALSVLTTADPNHLDWILVAPQSSGTEQAIQQLDQLAQQQGFQAGSVKVGDRSVSAWTRISKAAESSSELTTQVQGLFTQVGNYGLFSNSAAGMEAALQSPQHPLLTASSFVAGVKNLPPVEQIYFYGNIAQSRAVLTQQFPVLRIVEWVSGPLLDCLESVTARVEGQREGIYKAQLFLTVQGATL